VVNINNSIANDPYSVNGPTNLERMQEDFYNPIDVLEGNLGWVFRVEIPKSGD
jgi:hypothetical protein